MGLAIQLYTIAGGLLTDFPNDGSNSNNNLNTMLTC